MTNQTIPKSAFANPDARVRCPSEDCLGDLVLMPIGPLDPDGVPRFADSTVCPLCMSAFALAQDVADRDLYLRIAWLRANPDAARDDALAVGLWEASERLTGLSSPASPSAPSR